MSSDKMASCLGPWFEEFLAMKRSGGRDYRTQSAMLRRFDAYLSRNAGDPNDVDADIVARYLSEKNHLAPRGRANIVSLVWQALSYASRRGAGSSCPPERPRLPRRQILKPYIYAEDEIASLLRACGELGPKGSLRPHTMTTLVGLLVTTGMRVGEAMGLNLGDFDSGRHLLTIREGKFRKSRIVPLHPTTTEALARYQRVRQLARPGSMADAPFFVSLLGRRPSHGAIKNAFDHSRRRAGIRRAGGQQPRIHDLRHTFAVRRVLAWYRAGMDVGQRLPALSTYLGHVDISCTMVYLQPNEATLLEAAERFEARCPVPLLRDGGSRHE